MGDLFILVISACFFALAIYCFWHGLKALRTGTVESPTMLSPGKTDRSEAPVSYWFQVGFWFAGAGVVGFNAARWVHAIVAT
jgi:hypothetical protein